MEMFTKIGLFLSFVVLMFSGCSKDGNGPAESEDYYFRFKVDGIQQAYTARDQQINLTGSSQYDEQNGVYAINIAGMRNILESGKHTLTVFVSDTEGFAAGTTYSNIPGEGDDYPDFVFSMGYHDGAGNLFVAGGAGDKPLAGLYEPAFVTFTEIAENYMSGTFSGTLNWYESSSGTNILMGTVVISDGQFKVPMH